MSELFIILVLTFSAVGNGRKPTSVDNYGEKNGHVNEPFIITPELRKTLQLISVAASRCLGNRFLICTGQ